MDNVNKKPVVSVISIFFNEEKFIEDAVKSVFAQTYHEWELLLVDDGSTDKSTEIARRFAEQRPERVRYFEHDGHENRGMSATRNLGIRNAKGDYIAFLDADDMWLPHKLDRQVGILNLYPEADMICGPSQLWHSWTGHSQDLQSDSMREIGVKSDALFKPPTLFTLFLRHEVVTPATCSALLKRGAFKTVGEFEEAFRGMYEDQVFFAKVYLQASVYVASECLDRYRQHPDSHTAISDKNGPHPWLDFNPALQVFLTWLEGYVSEQQVIDADFRQMLQEVLSRRSKWWLRVVAGNVAYLEFPPNKRDMVRIAIKKAETKRNFDIQLSQPRLRVKSNHSYSVHFQARADSPRSLTLGFAKAYGNWDGLGLYREIRLTTEWQNFVEDFIATADEDNARIHFDVGDSDISVEFASVILRSLATGEVIQPPPISMWTRQPERNEVALR